MSTGFARSQGSLIALEITRSLLSACDQAMEAEGICEYTRERVVNMLVYGHPDGMRRRAVTDDIVSRAEMRELTAVIPA